MKYLFNTWYNEGLPGKRDAYLFVTDIRSPNDPDGFFGWHLDQDERDEPFFLEFQEDFGDPAGFVNSGGADKQEDPPLEEAHQTKMIQDLFSI